MAKFVTEDGKGGISGDRFIDGLKKYGYEHKSYSDFEYSYTYKRHTDVKKLKEPHGRDNREKILNTNIYDLLSHIQETLSLSNRCILEIITNEYHTCLKTNDTILRRIHQFADKHMNDDFKNFNPKIKMRIKVGEDEYTERLETDDEWNDRLCHIYMHQFHQAKLQMIKCEECIQHWMNDDKW